MQIDVQIIALIMILDFVHVHKQMRINIKLLVLLLYALQHQNGLFINYEKVKQFCINLLIYRMILSMY